MLKTIKVKASLLLISVLLVLAACSNAVTEEAVPTPTPKVEVKETVVEEVVEEEVSEPVSYLLQALETAKKTETIWFSSGVSDSYYMYSNENNMLASAYDYFFSLNGQLSLSPASLKVEDSFMTSLQEFDENGNSTLHDEYTIESTTYLVAGDGYYTETLGNDKWYKYPISDDFRTAEQLEKLLGLFLNYPEQLEIVDAFNEGNNPDAAIIEYKLTNEQFVQLSNDFRQGFFSGNFESADVELTMPNAESMNNLYMEISVDKEFNILGYSVSYMDAMVNDETSNPNDYYYYSLHVYFYSPNEDFVGMLPDEVRQTAVLNEGEGN